MEVLSPAMADILAGVALAVMAYIAANVRGIRRSVERTERAVFGTEYDKGLIAKVDDNTKRIDVIENE